MKNKHKIETNIKHSKLTQTEMQLGWKWNPIRMDWITNEDYIDTSRKINPKLVKYTAHSLAASFPEQFKKLNLCTPDDCTFLASICSETMRAMSLHNKISSSNAWGHKRNVTDEKSTPFEILNVAECRRVMMRFTNMSLNPQQNNQLVENKIRHLKQCQPCFKIFRNVSINK